VFLTEKGFHVGQVDAINVENVSIIRAELGGMPAVAISRFINRKKRSILAV